MRGSITKSVDRTWRVFATGLSFAVFGVGAFLLGGIVCMAMRLIIHDREAYSQAVRRLISRAFYLFVTFMCVVGVLRWRAAGWEHRHRGRHYLVIANHPTLIDIVFLIGFFAGADCVVKGGVIRNPAWALLVRAADYVSNEDPAELMDECVRRLGAGRTVVLFPEGTRTVPGQALHFGAVAASIAVRSSCQCLPVIITCDPPTLYKGLPWYRAPVSRPEFVLRVCPPISVGKVGATAADKRNAARAFTAELEKFFTRQLTKSPAEEAPEDSRPAATPVL